MVQWRQKIPTPIDNLHLLQRRVLDKQQIDLLASKELWNLTKMEKRDNRGLFR